MTQKESEDKALKLASKWKDIVADAIRNGLLVDDLCLGCGKRGCTSCPAGTTTGWNPSIKLKL
jgi:hypothetical protein